MRCRGDGCPFKRGCRCYVPESYRADWMEFFIDVPYDTDSQECMFYWERRTDD